MSVVFDNFTSVSGANVSTLTTPSFTITSAANRAGVVKLTVGANATAISALTLGGVNGTAVPGTDTGTSIASKTVIYQVTAPPSGSQTASVTLGVSDSLLVGVVTASGVDQTTSCNNGNFSFSVSTGSASLAITSTNGDLTVDIEANNGTTGTDTTNQIAKWQERVTGGPGGNLTSAGGIGPGTGSTTHTWTTSGTAFLQSGCNFKAGGESVGSANITSSAGRFIGWTT